MITMDFVTPLVRRLQTAYSVGIRVMVWEYYFAQGRRLVGVMSFCEFTLVLAMF